MIPRKYASLNSPIIAINVITSCLSTVTSDCSSIFSVKESSYGVRADIISETEISEITTTSEKTYSDKDEEYDDEYQDCTDNPSIIFGENYNRSQTSMVIDAKKIKPALPLHQLYAYTICRARIYKSFPKKVYHEVRYAKEQGVWSPPNDNPTCSVVLMVSGIIPVKEENYHPPIIEGSVQSICSQSSQSKKRKGKVIINEELINHKFYDHDIKEFGSAKEFSDPEKIYEKKLYATNVDEVNMMEDDRSSTYEMKNSLKGKHVSKNFKGSMTVKDRISESSSTDLSEYTKKITKRRSNCQPHALNAYFSKDNIQYNEYINFDTIPEAEVMEQHNNFKTKIYVANKKSCYNNSIKSSTVIDTINEKHALEEGDIDYSMIGTEITNIETSSTSYTEIEHVDHNNYIKQLNEVINIENQNSPLSSELITLPNTFSFLSKDYTTTVTENRINSVVETINYSNNDGFLTNKLDNDESIVYEDMLQQLDSLKKVLKDFENI
uniref:Fork-head domain-containing protein n=1 Tax=Parastrongyloides trichosuri TaxID=131310 RepID=A0A0N5A1L6_PARTI